LGEFWLLFGGKCHSFVGGDCLSQKKKKPGIGKKRGVALSKKKKTGAQRCPRKN